MGDIWQTRLFPSHSKESDILSYKSCLVYGHSRNSPEHMHDGQPSLHSILVLSRMYKHFLSVSSQISFCSAPVRLDSYNACQFSCGYCYARARTGSGREAKLAAADASTLEMRLHRVNNGIINSALDEFLQHRTPIQFGGMSDPLMPIEAKIRSTLKIMQVLKDDGYPYLLSTKGKLLFEDIYIDALSNANTLVRVSFAGCSEELRRRVDRGALSYETFLSLIGRLRDRQIKVGLRLQPLIPGQEQHAAEMIMQLPVGCVDHVSAEYLKVPVSADKKFGDALLNYFDGSVITWYRDNSSSLVGNEYVLPAGYRRPHLKVLRDICTSKGITFGYADNDFLILSDGDGCCSGSDIYLKNSNIFRANTLGILRNNISKGNDLFEFDTKELWYPKKNISQYLNSKTRIYRDEQPVKDWQDYLAASWQGEWGQYSPDYFLKHSEFQASGIQR